MTGVVLHGCGSGMADAVGSAVQHVCSCHRLLLLSVCGCSGACPITLALHSLGANGSVAGNSPAWRETETSL